MFPRDKRRASNSTTKSRKRMKFDDQQIARSYKWPFHPCNQLAIGKVEHVNGYRVKGTKLQYHVTDNNVHYQWVNVTEINASSALDKFRAKVAQLVKSTPKPKPQHEFERDNQRIIVPGSNVPVCIIAHTFKETEQGDQGGYYMVQNERGQIVSIEQEYIKENYYYLVEEYKKRISYIQLLTDD